jgi:tRNA threonylcarbamoyladenosine biosynthesis protein TsaB
VPPTLLALDTATDVCSLALALDGEIVEVRETVGQKHSERILPMLHSLLRDKGIELADCDAIAFGAGPGAFTGLRVACGIAQGLAYGAGKPVLAVGNLAALAAAALADANPARRILVAIDARMQEIYWALYEADDGALTEIGAPALAAAADLEAICGRAAPDLVAGNALRLVGGTAGRLGCAIAPDAAASAAAVARLALRRYAEGGAQPPELAAPIYVRDRVALTVDERRAAAAPGLR